MLKTKKLTLNLVKISFFLMLIYSVFFLAVLNLNIPRMTLILGGLTVVFMIVDMFYTEFDLKRIFTAEVWLLLGFIAYCLLTSLLFADYKNSAVDGLITLIENVVLMVVTVYLILRDKSIKFVAATFIIAMSLMAIYSLVNLENVTERLTLTESTNANVLGHNAMCALTLLPLFIKQGKRLRNLLLIAISVALVATVILSGSRMSFICLIVFAVLFFIRVYPMSINSVKKSSIGIKLLVGVIAFAGVAFLIISTMRGTLLYERMESLFVVFETGEGDGQGRIDLYERAWRLFKTNPITGVGYANYAASYHGTYSHSTYAELLSCTGILGCLIFLAFYLRMLIGAGKKRGEKGTPDLSRTIMLIAFAVIIVLGIGEIVFYKINYFIIFGLIIGNRILSKEKGETHAEAESVADSV